MLNATLLYPCKKVNRLVPPMLPGVAVRCVLFRRERMLANINGVTKVITN